MPDGAGNMTLRDALQTVCLEKSKVLTVFAVTVAIALAGVYLSPQSYETEARLLIRMGRESGSPAPTIMRPGQMVLMPTQALVNSEIQILRNRHLVAEVVDRIGVPELTRASPPRTLMQHIKHVAKLPMRMAKQAASWALDKLDLKKKLPLREALIEGIYAQLKCDTAQDSNIVILRLSWSDPTMAARIVNELLASYVALHLKAYGSQGAYDLFTDQVRTLKDELAAAEKELAEVKKEWHISELDKERDLLLEQQAEVEGHLRAVQEEQASITAEVRALLSPAKPGSERRMEIDAIQRDPVVDNISTQVAALESELERMRRTYLEGSEPLRDVEERLKAARVRLNDEIGHTIDVAVTALRRKSTGLDARRNELQEAQAGLVSKLAMFDQRQAGMKDALQRIEHLRESIDLYDRRGEESRINAIMDAHSISSVNVVEPAMVPPAPSRPRKVLTLAVALAFGPVLGIAFGLASRALDRSLISRQQVEEIGLRPLAVVPLEPRTTEIPLLDGAGSSTMVGREVRQLMVELQQHRIVAFGGAASGVGTSFLAVSFAHMFAGETGKRTLLVDADLGHAHLPSLQADGTSAGVRELLRGEADAQSLPKATRWPGLEVVPVGAESAAAGTHTGFVDAAALERWKQALAEWCSSYGMVVIDLGNTLEETSARQLARRAEGVVLVAEWNRTRRDVLAEAAERLGRAGANVLGSALNKRAFVIPAWIYDRL